MARQRSGFTSSMEKVSLDVEHLSNAAQLNRASKIKISVIWHNTEIVMIVKCQ
jgi:hypothetical protein